ncbi:MAG TPA: hypothetical protein VGH27_30165 [Streptosporangiaceae bacterium]|jgi:hypothetical protein
MNTSSAPSEPASGDDGTGLSPGSAEDTVTGPDMDGVAEGDPTRDAPVLLEGYERL